MTNVLRIAAFSAGNTGGNPAGVWLGPALPADLEMQAMAKAVGFSETVFATPFQSGQLVRYFSPEMEVPFCGHATIALGAALAMRGGDGVFRLKLNDAEITVEGRASNGTLSAALQSPPTRSQPAPPALVAQVLALFGYDPTELEATIPPAMMHAGADHLLVALKSRKALRAMVYDFDAGRQLMRQHGLVTICLVHTESSQRFHARNAFAAGGVLEDPATGAAAAAFGGYLRDIDWPHRGSIEIIQGEDMGMISRIQVQIPPAPGSSIRVSGAARVM